MENSIRTGEIEILREQIQQICNRLGRQINIMEVCGTHTMAISRFGLRGLMPENLRLISGPGCPVCVTSSRSIGELLALAQSEQVTVLTFGDLLRVPGQGGSLELIRAKGAKVKVLYSPAESLEMAATFPGNQYLFAGIGFETTAPLFAALLLEARRRGLENLSILPMLKLVPPAMEAICQLPGVKVDSFILPGHVSSIIGSDKYKFLAEKYHLPGVVTGFEALDVMQGIFMLLKQMEDERAEIGIQYKRAVKPEGNIIAQQKMEDVFYPSSARWRGIGEIPGTGLAIREEFAAFDGYKRFKIDFVPKEEKNTCICGALMIGKALPTDCPNFKEKCTPADPMGPCMVSSEGACAAYYKYGG